MSITKFAVEHATAVIILIFCLLVGGLLSYNSLPREAAPDIAIPIVIVSTPYFGVSPSDIETLVTVPVEKKMKALKGIKKMTSTSAESVSMVTIEFDTSVNIEDALQKVREKVDNVKVDLPPDAEDTQVIEVSSSDWPVLMANLAGDMDSARLKNIAEDIQDDLEKIPGVLRVDIAGGVEKEVQIMLDPDKLRYRGVSVNQVAGAIQSENLNLPGGSLEVGSMKYLLRVPGEFKTVSEIENIVVKSPGGNPIYLRDVASAKMGYKDRSTYSRLLTFTENANGDRVVVAQPNVSLSVVKRAGENIIDIADKAKAQIKQYQSRLSKDVNVTILNDMSENIRSSVSDLENNIISGVLLVVAVLFFFMGGARNALMVSLNIPLSMLMTFIVLSVLGITLNMVVLFSLILALGMLVDNSIVVVENIYRHASDGKDIRQASLDGTTEVGWAIIASTATTVGAFFPMVFWPGVMGQFMGYLPKTVIITLLCSLFVALVINPTLCALFLKVVPKKEGEDEFTVPDNVIYRSYRWMLTGSLNHRVIITLVSFGALIVTFMLFGKFNRGVEFFPEGTPEQFSVNVEIADGSRVQSTRDVMERIGKGIKGEALTQGMSDEQAKSVQKALNDGALIVDSWVEDTGVGGASGMGGGGSQAAHFGRISVDLKKAADQTTNPDDFMAALRDSFERIPGASIIIEKQSQGPPAGKPVSVEIVGDDLIVMASIARQVKDILKKTPGIIDLDDNVELSRPEITVNVNREKASLLGLSTQSIATTVRTAFNGSKASSFRDGDDEYDITLRLPERLRTGIVDLSSLTIVNKDGVHIPLTEVATIVVQGGTGSIRHKDQERVVTVSANAASGFLPAEVLKSAQTRLKDLQMPAGYTIRYAGETEDQKEAGEFLAKALLAALFIITLILVTQFNSIAQPMIILFSVVLSLIGVLLSLIIAQEPFGIIMSGIGIISLAGVVVNNAIVLIDYANKLRDRGMTRREAVVNAGLVRFRPVMLTATTTVLGLMPLVVGVSIDFVNFKIVVGGASVDTWGPMARVISSGLVVATILTLIVVPVLYSLLDDIALFLKRNILDRMTVGMVFMTLFMVLPSVALAQEGAKVDDAPSVAATTPVSKTVEKSNVAATADVSASTDTTEAAQPDEGPDFSRPKDVVTTEFSRPKVDLSDAKIASSRTLSLAEAHKLLLKNNLDIKQAMVGIKIADIMVDKAFGTVLPSLVAQFSGTINQQEVSIQFPGAPPVVTQNKYDYNLGVSASVRLNPRAWPLLQQAYAGQDLSKMQVALLKDELKFAVTQIYYRVLSVRQLLDVRSAQLESSETRLKALELRKKAGVVRPFELTSQQLRLKQDRKALEGTKLQFIQARQALAAILLVKDDFDVENVRGVSLEQDMTQLQKMARSKRLNVKLDQKSLKLNELQLLDVYYQYLPNGTLAFNYRRPRGNAFQPGEWQWTLNLNLQWVIWDGGIREAEVDEKQANILRQKLKMKQTKSQLDNDIAQAFTQYKIALNQRESSREQVELARKALGEVQRAYKLGVAVQLEVVNAEDQLRLAELGIVQEDLNIQLSVERLKYLSGQD